MRKFRFSPLFLIGCGSTVDYDPGVTADQFQPLVSNPFMPHPVGARWVYSANTPDGVERDEIEVLAERKTVAFGVECTVVKDTVYVDGEIAEDTKDWYAQHSDGSVWYMGEDTAEYEDGQIINHNGAWEAGVDGALPGILMPATPALGQKYRQEFYAGEAEDEAEVVELDVSVTVAAGSYTGCIKTHDTSAIDSSLSELKYYCRGVGLVLVEEDENVRVELIESSGL
jgi:hypothetical protein